MRAPCPNCGDLVDRVEVAGVTIYGCARCCPTQRYVIPLMDLEASVKMLLEENARLVKTVNEAPEFLEAVKVATAGELKEIDGLRAVVDAVRTWSKIRHRSAADDEPLYRALAALDAPRVVASVACRFCDEFNPADASRCRNCDDSAWKPE